MRECCCTKFCIVSCELSFQCWISLVNKKRKPVQKSPDQPQTSLIQSCLIPVILFYGTGVDDVQATASWAVGRSVVTSAEAAALNASSTTNCLNTETSIKQDTALRENIVNVYLKADSTSFSKSTKRQKHKKPHNSKLRFMFPVRRERDSAVRAPTSEEPPPPPNLPNISEWNVHLVLTPKNKASHQLRLSSAGLVSSHSLFYLYYFSNTFCKCNMKSTITRKIDTSLWSR